MMRIVALLVVFVLSLAGCSTISGFGRDVEAVGGGVAAQPASKR